MSSFQSFQQNTPVSTGNSNQPQGLISKVGGFVSGAVKDAANTLLVTPAARATEAATKLFAPNSQEAAGFNAMDDSGGQNFSSPLGNINVPAQKAFGQGGGEQISGQALKSASYLAPAIGAEGIASKGIVGGAIQGTKLGAASGALGGAGQSMEEGGNTTDILGAGASGAIVGGAIGGVTGGAGGGVGNIWDTVHAPSSSYDSNLANATANATQAGADAVNSVTEASGTMNDVKTGLGNQFSEAPGIIAKTDPNAKVTLTPDIVDKLNALKDTKAFSLPASIREPGLPSDIKNIGSGELKLNPTQAQDLITQLNDLKFNSKGDVVVNQQTSSLVNDVKNASQNGLGHVTDAQGNSVWARAYQDYQQGSDARDAMSSLIPTTKTQGGVLDPTDVSSSISKMMKMMQTPEGRASLIQGNAQFKAATGYDLLNDPMGAIDKLINSNEELKSATKGNFGHQFIQVLKNPRTYSRRVVGTIISVLEIATLGTTFRKQIGGIISGQ